MPTTSRNDPAKLLHLAIDSFDAQIAVLQAIRAQLTAMIDRPSAASALGVATPQKRTLSAAARAKISAAAKARWDRERKVRAKKQKSKKKAKKTRVKDNPAKAKATSAQAKKSRAIQGI